MGGAEGGVRKGKHFSSNIFVNVIKKLYQNINKQIYYSTIYSQNYEKRGGVGREYRVNRDR